MAYAAITADAQDAVRCAASPGVSPRNGTT